MCTSVSFKTSAHYFGRNLDIDYNYNEAVTVTPRNFCFRFKFLPDIHSHYAIIGMSTVIDGYPLYYDATNEQGLSIAGLSFEGNAFYNSEQEGKINVASFELIPFILCKCEKVSDAERLLKNINITNTNFSDLYPATELHWMISDRNRTITVEQTVLGLKVYKNPVGILTNNPPFDIQMFNLNNFLSLSNKTPENLFSQKLDLQVYSRGMGAIGLPGDLSSVSRFVRAVFTLHNSVCDNYEFTSVNQFFHILDSVSQKRGLVLLDNKKYEITVYSSCTNTDEGIYYYKTYDNSAVNFVDMKKENLNGTKLAVYPLKTEPQFFAQN